jgi:hypothetical protein
VDEVKSIRNEAERMKLYAKQSNDKTMMADAAVLKDRATRSLGELMEAQRKTVRRARTGNGVSKKNPRGDITLAEVGIDKNLASSG